MEPNEAISNEKSEVEDEGDSSSALKPTNVPVVYKLVRVKVDGTLVPATDEDVIEAGLMLPERDEENKGDLVSDLVDPSSDKSDTNSLEGSSVSEKSVGSSGEFKDRIECVEAMLRKVNEEEKLRVYGSANVVTHRARERCLDNLTIRELQEAFMATFGRPTSVKDKRWLKQRLLEGDNFASKNLPEKRTSSCGDNLPPDPKRTRKRTKRYIEECSSGSLEEESRSDASNEAEGKKGEEAERKKRHRVWSMWEVTRLVEGVSKYGAGRWSEIKRLVFAPQSHRTAADLKDKWRNLLRASLNERPAENKKKHATKQNIGAPPMPSWIIARVRELAEI